MTLSQIRQYAKTLYLAGGAMVVIVVASILFVLPARDSINKLTQQINDERATLQALSLPAETTGIDQQSIEESLARVKGVFVDRTAALEFISSFEEIASSVGVKASLDLQQFDTASDQIQEIPIQITVDATYTNLVRFIQALYANPEYWVITSLSLTPLTPTTEETTQTTTIRTVLTGSTFWR